LNKTQQVAKWDMRLAPSRRLYPLRKCHRMADRLTTSAAPPPKPKSLADMTDEEFAQYVGPAPDWLQRLWAHSEANGLDKMTMEEIDEEIEAYRREKRSAGQDQTG
jgi:hypothetical protein